MRLLLLEDDAILGAGLRSCLQADGHVVEWCTRLGQARVLRDEPFDAWLIDWQLPDGSGVGWLQSRRGAGDTTPAIVLTARDRLRDRVQGLDAGADDYLVKPFDPEELSARLRAVMRRTAGASDARRHFGPVALDMVGRCAWLNDQRIALTAREWAIAEALALRAGRLVAKRDLEGLVLGLEADLASNALEVHVSSIRRKLGREFIETVRGMGYRVAA
jgi:two-component system, OmpR family, response regulator